MHIVYVLISEKNPTKYYIGLTENLDVRLKKHNLEHNNNYTKKYSPWKLETYISFSDIKLAEKFERYLKHGSGHVFLKRHLI